MKLSKHSKLRMKERTEFNHNERKRLFRDALNNGLDWGGMKDCPLKDYLRDISERNCKVKAYKGYVFIYSKNGSQLYTMYKLPKKFLEKEVESDER